MSEPNDVEVMGIVGFHWSFRVTAAEMRDWEPARITAFFAGMAQVLRLKAVEQNATVPKCDA